jgi:hypothetical protein
MSEVSVSRRPGRPARIRPIEDGDFSGESRVVELDEQEGPMLSAFLHSTPAQVRLRYRETLTKSQALDELAKLRSVAQYAAEEINQRLVPDEEKCMICGVSIAAGVKVPQMVIVKDQATGTSQTKVLCSINCIREHNRNKMGLAELVK